MLRTCLDRHGVRGKSYYSFDYRSAHFIVLGVADDQICLGAETSWENDSIVFFWDARHTRGHIRGTFQ